ncbi:MAG: M20 family metallopeptidase [Chloroflexota bacterium]|nr:M20 family metallopeptidase [Chloroflexota bacterium]
MGIGRLKAAAVDEVDAQRGRLVELSHRIHDNPELGFQETKASCWLGDYLDSHGFQVESGICQLPTASRARYGTNKPAIAFLAEYDALPEMGHACGHNIVGVAAAGAAVAVRRAIDEKGGTAVVMCTPAEESDGGKILMAQRGGFDNLDAAMLVHPAVMNVASVPALACIGLEVEFFGKATHASGYPEEGINALDAMIQAFVGIGSLRQHIDERARIHGIITDGGEAANIVPAHTSATFLIRAEDRSYLRELSQKVLNCFRAASMATGARLAYNWGEAFNPIVTNHALAAAFSTNMESLGRDMSPIAERGYGSSDMGNVCTLVPCIHAMVAIAPSTVMGHTPEFSEAAASKSGDQGLIDAAKAMAMTFVDLVATPDLQRRVTREFAHARPGKDA